jgi:hypothetical protein
VGAPFRGARRIHINRIEYCLLMFGRDKAAGCRFPQVAA